MTVQPKKVPKLSELCLYVIITKKIKIPRLLGIIFTPDNDEFIQRTRAQFFSDFVNSSPEITKEYDTLQRGQQIRRTVYVRRGMNVLQEKFLAIIPKNNATALQKWRAWYFIFNCWDITAGFRVLSETPIPAVPVVPAVPDAEV
jgi:hypothetical protein